MGKKARNRRRAVRRRQQARAKQLDDFAAEMRRVMDDIIAAAVDENTDPDEVAGALMAFFDGTPVRPDLPERILQKSSRERAISIGDALLRRDPESTTALTFAAAVTDDPHLAATLLEGAVDAEEQLADAYLKSGRIADALEILDEECAHEPLLTDTQCARAEALAQAQRRLASLKGACTCGSGKTYARCCKLRERASLNRFTDPAPLYELRDALLAYSDDVRFSAWHDRAMSEWFGDDPAPPDSAELEGNIRFAIERGWVALPAVGDDGPSMLEAFTDDESNPAELRLRAIVWQRYARYGLWRIDEPVAQPDVRLTDVITEAHVHAAVPPEYLEGVAPGTIFLCSVIPVDGVWRTGGSVIKLPPRAGAALAADVRKMAYEDARRIGEPTLLAAFKRWETEPVDFEDPLAEYLSSIVAVRLPELDEMIRQAASTPPVLQNTDGDPMLLHRVRLRVPGIGALEHDDVEVREDEVLWFGRPLTAQERKEQREWAKREGIPITSGGERWMRGRFERSGDELVGELNSKRRLDDWLDLLKAAGLAPELLDVTRFDPAQDLAWDRSHPST